MTLFEKIQALQEGYQQGLYADDEYEQLVLEHALAARLEAVPGMKSYHASSGVILKVDHSDAP